ADDGVRFDRMGCGIYGGGDLSWINRRGGCPHFPYRQIPRSRGEYLDGEIVSGGRVGQQKQSVNDRKYHSKNDGKRKYTHEFTRSKER
ncbi:MAG: hypothetical protein ACXABY_30765, partial [Candidatus Thorarchaeota archaeon]